jgi:hypothetical protein
MNGSLGGLCNCGCDHPLLVLIAVNAGSRIVPPRDVAEPGDVSD